MSLRDQNGFLINPKSFSYGGYRIEAMQLDGVTCYDVYFGHVYRDTFKAVEDAKAWIDQPKF